MRARTIVASLYAIGCAAMASPPLDCASAEGKARLVVATKALIESTSKMMDTQDSALKAGVSETAARTGWSDRERALFFQRIMHVEPNIGYDKQIKQLA